MGLILQHNIKPSFPAEANSEEYARKLDSQDSLAKFRNDFIFPTKKSLKNKNLHKPGPYLCQIIAKYLIDDQQIKHKNSVSTYAEILLVCSQRPPRSTLMHI